MAFESFLGIERADLPLTCAGGLLAVGMSVTAGAMMIGSDGSPRVNGAERMAVFAKPARVHEERVRAQATTAPAAPQIGEASAPPRQSVDFLPTASIPRRELRASPPEPAGYALVGARRGSATFRGPAGDLLVKPGDLVPGLGRVQAITPDGKGWTVVLGESETARRR